MKKLVLWLKLVLDGGWSDQEIKAIMRRAWLYFLHGGPARAVKQGAQGRHNYILEAGNMVKTVEGRFTVCVWRDMVLMFERLPGGWIRASGGEERARYLHHSMTEVIRKYRKEQLESGEQARAKAREAWEVAHNG